MIILNIFLTFLMLSNCLKLQLFLVCIHISKTDQASATNSKMCCQVHSFPAELGYFNCCRGLFFIKESPESDWASFGLGVE